MYEPHNTRTFMDVIHFSPLGNSKNIVNNTKNLTIISTSSGTTIKQSGTSPRRKCHLQDRSHFGAIAVIVLLLNAFSGTATAQSIPVPQLVRQVVEPYLGPVYDGVNGAANLILNEVPHLTLEPFPLNHVHIDDGGLGEFLQGIDFFDHVDEISNLEPFPLNHIHIDDGGLGEFLQGVDFVDEVDDVMNVAGDALDNNKNL